MANRTGTYFAFDGLGNTNPSQSDFRYYSSVKAWNVGKHVEFKFVNSHDKASAVRDTSKKTTLEASIRQRLATSKNVVVIISSDTRKSGSMLSYEIEKAIDQYSLPLIIAYTGYNAILEPSSLSDKWPDALSIRINNETAKAIHIPFKKDAIFDAIGRFTINGNQPSGSLVHYTRQTQVNWGYIGN